MPQPPRSRPRRRPRRSRPLGLALLTLAAGPALAWSKPPSLVALFPAGASRGQTVEVTAQGEFDRWPVRAWVDGEGVSVEPGADKGKLAVTVGPDARPGLRWIRLFDDEGASALRPFLVGTAPEAVEAEPNDDPQAAQTLDLSGGAITVNGRLSRRRDVDGYAVRLERGETLVAALEANRKLGSPMDGILQVATPEGFVLEANDDEIGLDPRVVFVAQAGGTYVVRTFAFPAQPNQTIDFAGDDSYIYRLTLSKAGTVDHAFPLAVTRSEPAEVDLIPWDLPGSARSKPVAVEVGAEAGAESALVWHPELTGEAEVRIVAHPAIVEADPDKPGAAQSLPIPATVSGRIDPAGDRDEYGFRAEAGQALSFRIEARALGLPLDPLLRVVDEAGKVVAEVDDAGKAPDPALDFKAKAAGLYRLSVRDLQGRGGPRYAYRLTARAPEADFRVSLAADRFVLESAKPLEIPVEVAREGGFEGKIEVQAEGLPEGVSAEAVVSEPEGKTSKSVRLILKANGPDRWSGPFRVIGRSLEGEESGRLVRPAKVGTGVNDASTERAWLTVVGEPEVKPEPAKDEAEAPKG